MSENPKLTASSFMISVDGQTINQAQAKGLEMLVIEDHVDMVDMLTARIGGGEGQPKWSYSIGQKIKAKAGKGDDYLFQGEIIAVEPSWTGEGYPTMTIRAMDEAHRLARGRKTRTFLNKKDSDIASEVGAECGLSVTTDPTTEVHPYTLQRNESNLTFLKRLAARNNFQLTVDPGKLVFQKASTSGQAVTIDYGKSVRSLRFNFNSSEQVNKVVVRGWDPKQKKEIIGTASAGDIASIGGGSTGASQSSSKFGDATAYITDVPVTSQSMANELAKAEINRLARQFCQGTCTVEGNDKIKAGAVIQFNGLPGQYNGKYYVISSRHIVNAHNGYVTEFTFCSNTFGG